MSFNLKRYLAKTANYEGAQGYFVGQTRTWQNCVRTKMASGNSAMDSWESCLEQYQSDRNSLKWISDNVVEDKIKRNASVEQAVQPWFNLIEASMKHGDSIEVAVRKAILNFKSAQSVIDKEMLEEDVANNDGDLMNAVTDTLDDLGKAAKHIKNEPKRSYKDQSKKEHPHSGRLDTQLLPRHFDKNYKYEGEK